MFVCGVCGGMAKDTQTGAFMHSLEILAQYIVQKDWTMLYGGVRSGLVGALADHVLERQGKVQGAIAEFEFPDQHTGVTQIQSFSTFKDRKAYLFQQSNMLLFLPGGLGTFDEVFSLLIDNKVGTQSKPMILWNAENFWDPVLQLLDRAERDAFLNRHDLRHLLITQDVQRIDPWLSSFSSQMSSQEK